MQKAKHAFGALERVDQSIADGIIDSFDVLFLKDENGKPYVGWVDKDGQKVIVDDSAEFEALESELEAKVTEVNAKIDQAVSDSEASAKAYVDGKVEAAINEHMTKRYEVSTVPTGTLVDYRDNEIRIMCPENAEFVKQAVGAGGDANSYYCTFKTYVPNDAVAGYVEHLGDTVDPEILTDFSVDEFGRRYQPTWLAIAKYDEETGVWNYYGSQSTAEKYIGWNYQIDWYDENGVMIESDSVRINLSNEDCHAVIAPYYVANAVNEAKTYTNELIEAKIAEVNSGFEIIEF